jgi:peptidoglycan hydrolase-like protein with peptidoglycan-binding domain
MRLTISLLTLSVATTLTAPALGQQSPSPGNQVITQEEVSGTGATLSLSPATVRQIQQELNRRGYHAGHVDGSWGPITATATRNFQQAQGLEPTGRPNLRTLSALSIELPQGQGREQSAQARQ